MTSRIAAIAIDAVQPEVVAGFWCEVLGWEVVETEEDAAGATIGVTIGSVDPADASGPVIDVYAVPEPKQVKNRLHLDLRADGTTTEQELQRLLDLGARRADVGQDPESSWVVLADPEGNELCLLARTVQDVRDEADQVDR